MTASLTSSYYLSLPVPTSRSRNRKISPSLPPSLPLHKCPIAGVLLSLIQIVLIFWVFTLKSVSVFCVCVFFSILRCPFCHCQYSFLPSSILLLFEIFLSLSPVTYQYYTEAVNLLQHPSLSAQGIEQILFSAIFIYSGCQRWLLYY